MNENAALAAAKAAAEILDAKKAVDVKILDVSGHSGLWDYFVVCSGLSGVHVKTLYDNVKDGMAKIGHNAAHADTGHDNKWVILDFGDVLVHIFDAQSREYYSIERIWGEKASNAAKFIKEMTGKSKTKKERTKKIEKTAKKRPLFK